MVFLWVVYVLICCDVGVNILYWYMIEKMVVVCVVVIKNLLIRIWCDENECDRMFC